MKKKFIQAYQDGFDAPSGATIVDENGNIKYLSPPMTMAERLVLVPYEGLEVYQSDNSPGKYVYSEGNWCRVSNLGWAFATLSVAVNPVVGTLFNFSAGVDSRGIVGHDGAGKFTLYPGVYDIQATVNTNPPGGMYFQIYDYTNLTYLGRDGTSYSVVGYPPVATPCSVILNVSSQIVIGVRCTGDNATLSNPSGSWLKIIQIA